MQTLKEVLVPTISEPRPETGIISGEQSGTVRDLDEQEVDCQLPGNCLETQPTVQDNQENLPTGEPSATDESVSFETDHTGT